MLQPGSSAVRGVHQPLTSFVCGVALPELWSLGGTNCYFWVYFNKGCIAELVPC